jgi:hypothetical protein
MANTNIENPTPPLPKRGPVWTFYVWSVFAVLVVAATIIGLKLAGIAHWW